MLTKFGKSKNSISLLNSYCTTGRGSAKYFNVVLALCRTERLKSCRVGNDDVGNHKVREGFDLANNWFANG